ncbi:MAG: ABC transporter substrate-binding protein, partial [Janthinobacterium lividum]
MSALVSFATVARAADDILIGAVYPLSGAAAAIGADAQAAIETEAAIINGGENVPSMLFGNGGGLPNLGGAHVKIVWADSQNNPQIARTEAERLITQGKVVAIIGSYTSATAVTISQICDRYQIPYISADNSSPSLNKQGLSWFFRPSPTDVGFTGSMFDFIDWAGKNGHPIGSVAIIHENSVFGTDSAKLQASMAEKAGIKVAADLAYQASTPSLSVEAQRLKAADADLVLPSSYTSDAILLMRSMHDAGYTPKAVL